MRFMSFVFGLFGFVGLGGLAGPGMAAPPQPRPAWPQVVIERPHQSSYTSLGKITVSAQSSDDRFLATSDGTNRVKVWRLPERQMLTEFTWNSPLRDDRSKYPLQLAFAPQGDRLAVLTVETDAPNNNEVALHDAGLFPIAIIHLEQGTVSRLKLKPRSLNQPGHRLRDAFIGMAWTRDGEDVITLSKRGTITAWSAIQGTERAHTQLPFQDGTSGLSADAALAVFGDVLYRINVNEAGIQVDKVADMRVDEARLRPDWRLPAPVTTPLGAPLVLPQNQGRLRAAAAVARDGALVARATSHHIVVLDLTTGRSLSRRPRTSVPASRSNVDMPAPTMALSNQGAVAFVAPGGNAAHQVVQLEMYPHGLEPEDGASALLVPLAFRPEQLVYAPDGKTLWVLSARHGVIVLDAASGAVLRQAPAFGPSPDSTGVTATRWLRDGLLVAVDRGSLNMGLVSLLFDVRLAGPPRHIADGMVDRDPKTGRWLISEYDDLSLAGATPESSPSILRRGGAGRLIAASPGTGRRVAACEVGVIEVTNLDTRKTWRLIPHGAERLVPLQWVLGGRAIWSFSEDDDSISYWFPDEDRQIVIRPQNTNEALGLFSSDGFYWAQDSGADTVRFRVKDRVYPFEQFDLVFHRPDRVLGHFGLADRKVLDVYRRTWEKRLLRMGLEPQHFENTQIDILPTLDLHGAVARETEARTISLPLSARTERGQLTRLFVEVSGVPLFGVGGKPLQGTVWSDNIEVPLSSGDNDIAVSVLTDGGLESLAVRSRVTRTSAPARPPVLHTIAIGVSQFKDRRFELRFAAKDARDITDAFARVAGQSGRQHVAHLLTNGEASRDAILALRSALEATAVDDQVVVFIASHGILDNELNYHLALHDTDFSASRSGSLRYEEVESLLDGIPARHKLVLLDACHAGEADEDDGSIEQVIPDGIVRARGFVRPGLEPTPNRNTPQQTALRSRDLFIDLRRHNGAMVIAAAAGREWALESDVWANGLFTASVLEAVRDRRADHDNDRRVRVLELSDYVTWRVRDLTAGQQNPNARAVNRKNDFIVAE